MQETKINKKHISKKWHIEDDFLDATKVGAALLECLVDNDTESFIEIIDSYLRINKLQVAKNAQLSRSTVHLALSKSGNPTLKTLAKIVHEASLRR
jgi:DNA-binding phage protein